MNLFKSFALILPHRMTQTTGTTTRVIGWYHSHPHITVLPSHVDVRTQAMYQLLDSGFIGLIFSCFSEDSHKVGRIQVIAFQSSDGKQKHIARAVPVSPVINNSIIEVESSWSSSENMLSTSGAARSESIESDTGDSRLAARSSKGVGKSSDLEQFFAHADVNYEGREKRGADSIVPYNGDNLQNTDVDTDSMEMSASMQEAMHRSNLDMSGAEFVRKEIPLQVLPTRTLLKLDCPLTSFTEMQHVLFEEERAAYNQATSQNIRDGKLHPLAFIHHTSTYHASMCKLMEYCLSPAINALQDRLKENEIRLTMLVEEAKALEVQVVNRRSESGLESPQKSPTRAHRGGLAFSPRDSAGSRSPSGSTGSRSRKSS